MASLKSIEVQVEGTKDLALDLSGGRFGLARGAASMVGSFDPSLVALRTDGSKG